MRIKFLKDPCGIYRLSYEVGEVVDLPDPQAKELIETGHAEKTKEPVGHFRSVDGLIYVPQSETATSKVKSEKR